jgi:hypothetical protein
MFHDIGDLRVLECGLNRRIAIVKFFGIALEAGKGRAVASDDGSASAVYQLDGSATRVTIVPRTVAVAAIGEATATKFGYFCAEKGAVEEDEHKDAQGFLGEFHDMRGWGGKISIFNQKEELLKMIFHFQ